MPVIHSPRGLHRAVRAAAVVAAAVVLLAYTPGPATAASATAPAASATAPAASATAPAASATAPAAGPAEVRAAKARLLAAVEPCSTRVPRNDVVALGRCAQDLAVPDAQAHGIIDLIYTFFHCLHLQWANGTWDGPYPTIGTCMEVHGY